MTQNNFTSKLVSSYLAGEIQSGSDLTRFIVEYHDAIVREPETAYTAEKSPEKQEKSV